MELTDTSKGGGHVEKAAAVTLATDGSGYEEVLDRIDDLTNAEIDAILNDLDASPGKKAVALE
jgi:hypothetical protein